jgi:GH25 family lysozyme M1 (1,4-beta-N-acetylmuramidase)
MPFAAAPKGGEAVATVYGIDVSQWQGKINWQRVVAEKTAQGQQIQFAYIRATYGSDTVDPQFVANWQNSCGLLPRGAYHYFLGAADARAQAECFIHTIKEALAATGEKRLELPPVVDVEDDAHASAQQVVAGLQTFLPLVEQAFGTRPIIYTGPWFWQGHLNDSPIFSQDHLLWLAVYGAGNADSGFDPPAKYPQSPSGWATISIWQNAVQKGVPGIEGLVDRDRIELPAGISVIDFLNQVPGRPPRPDDDLKAAMLQRARTQDCLQFNRDSLLFQRIVTDGYAPNSPEFSIEFGEASYQAQRAECLDGDGVRTYYMQLAPGAQVHYVIRTDGGTAPANLLRDALLAAAETHLALPFNKDAGLQRQIHADGYLPISAEFSLRCKGANYAAQCAEHATTGQMRVYYARDPDWNKVQFFERA